MNRAISNLAFIVVIFLMLIGKSNGKQEKTGETKDEEVQKGALYKRARDITLNMAKNESFDKEKMQKLNKFAKYLNDKLNNTLEAELKGKNLEIFFNSKDASKDEIKLREKVCMKKVFFIENKRLYEGRCV